MDLVNNNLTGTTLLDVSVAATTESGNDVSSNLVISQGGVSLVNLLESSVWTLTPNVQPTGGTTYGVNLYVANVADISALDDNKFFAVKRPDASITYADWNNFEATTTIPNTSLDGRVYNAGAGYAQRLGYTSFSKHAIVKSVVSLPVELLYFTADKNDGLVKLNWVTASEINNDYFVVERSQDGISFYAIAAVDGAGNSNSFNYYSAIDYYPLEGVSYYRLQQFDFDGASSYSEIVTVYDAPLSQISATNFYSDDQGLAILLKNPSRHPLVVLITDMGGKEILRKSISMDQTEYFFKMREFEIGSGVYNMVIFTNDEIHTNRFVIY
jgi:hypothetical protein